MEAEDEEEEEGEAEKEMLWSQRISGDHYKTGQGNSPNSIDGITGERK